jgi:hypothetical protein
VCQELIAHTALEEEIFYPSCRQSGVEDDAMDEAQVEHDGAKILINELMTQEPGDEFYDAKFKVLSEYVKHHVREEEKSDGIFAKAKQAGMDMSALGQRIATRKQELTAEIEAMSLEPSPVRSLQSIDNQQYRYDQEEDTMPRNSNNRERDEQGRFMSDDDRGYSRGSSRSSRSRYEEEDDRGGRGGSRGEYASRGRDDDDRSGSRGEYASRGRDDDDDRGGRGSSRSEYSSRGRDDDDDRGGRGRSGGRSQGGWFGDSEGHSEAARRGWERGDHGESGWFGDREGHSEASRRGWERGDHGESGWFGDREGHSEAARRGWEHGHRGQGGGDARGDSSRGGYSSRSRYEGGSDDDRGGRGRSGNGGGNGGNGGGGSSRGRSHGGWFGDSEGHSEASRRGWRNRD